MNKKGIIAVIVIIVLIILGFMAFGGKDSSTVPEGNGTETSTTTDSGTTKEEFAPVTKESTDSSLITRLKSVSVAAAETGTRVALQGGTAKFTDGAVKGTITLGDIAVEKEVGGTKYIISTLSVNSGGSGTFKYVVLFEDKNGNLTDKSYALVGDRVNITGIRADSVSSSGGVAQLVVSVAYLGHDKGEPLSSAPTVPHTKIFVAENGEFNPAKEIDL